MSDSLKQKTIKGVFWSGIDRLSVQGIQFIIMILMARILSPSDYGLIGMLAVFITISNAIVDSGFSNALIRKQDRSDIDYSTVFYFNILISVFLYFILFFAAPFIAGFYNSPQLISVTRVISVVLIINSLSVIQRVIFTINVDFKTQSKASILAILVSGIIGIILAYNEFGVWSLVIQTLLNALINMLFLWLLSKWRPLRVFSIDSFKNLYSFGSRLLASSILDTLYKNIYTIVIGKKFAAIDLGYYTRADQFVQLPSANITSILQRVTYPILSEIQNDNEKLSKAYQKFLRLSGFIVFPLMMGLVVLADPIVMFLLTDKWMFSAVLIQILCFSAMWYPIHAINLNLLQVKGKSNLFLRLEIIKKTVGVLILCVTIPLGIIPMCIGSIVSSLIALIINTHYTGKLINLGFFKQMKDLFPSILYSFSMGGIIFWIVSFVEESGLKLCLGIVVGFIYYITVSYLTKSTELIELIALIKNKSK